MFGHHAKYQGLRISESRRNTGQRLMAQGISSLILSLDRNKIFLSFSKY